MADQPNQPPPPIEDAPRKQGYVVTLQPVIIAIGVIVSWFVLFGMRRSWQAIVGALASVVHKPASWFRKVISFTVAGAIGLEVEAALTRGEDTLGKGAQATEPGTAGFIAGTAAALEYHAFTGRYQAADTWNALHGLNVGTIPKRQKAATVPALRSWAKVTEWVRSIARTANLALTTAIAAERAAARAGHAIPGIDARDIADGATRVFNRWRKWILGGVGALAFTGVVVRVLARQLPWFRCSNVDKLGRGVCRMDRGLLDSLLLDTLIIAGSISIVQLARECQDFTEVVTDAMGHFIREWPTEG